MDARSKIFHCFDCHFWACSASCIRSKAADYFYALVYIIVYPIHLWNCSYILKHGVDRIKTCIFTGVMYITNICDALICKRSMFTLRILWKYYNMRYIDTYIEFTCTAWCAHVRYDIILGAYAVVRPCGSVVACLRRHASLTVSGTYTHINIYTLHW